MKQADLFKRGNPRHHSGNEWPDDLVDGVTYPYECKHSAPPCDGCESWSQFDPVRGSLRNTLTVPYQRHSTK